MTSDRDFSDFHYQSEDGLRLHARIYGAAHEGKLPVICLPGLTRNARDFHDLALRLAQRRKVVVFDYRGRGGSDYDPTWKNYNIVVEARDVIIGMAALGLERGAFIGTSRGGLIILMLAALQPGLLKAVIFNDIGPVVEAAGLTHIRDYLAQRPAIRSWADAVEAQRAVHGASFPGFSDADWERLTRALYRDEDGRPVGDFDPALLNTVAGMDLRGPLPAMWAQFDSLAAIPVMVIRGDNSTLLSTATIAEMGRRHSGLESITVSGQGHPPMLETGALPEAIAAFIDKAEPA